MIRVQYIAARLHLKKQYKKHNCKNRVQLSLQDIELVSMGNDKYPQL